MPRPYPMTSEAIDPRAATRDRVKWTHAMHMTMHHTSTESRRAMGRSRGDACKGCIEHQEQTSRFVQGFGAGSEAGNYAEPLSAEHLSEEEVTGIKTTRRDVFKRSY